MLRKFAVRNIKPLLSDRAWQSLRHLSPGTTSREAELAIRAARAAQKEAELALRAARAAQKEAELALRAARAEQKEAELALRAARAEQKKAEEATRRAQQAAEVDRVRLEAVRARAAGGDTRPSLTDLAKKCRTDKWSKLHRYTQHYQRHLEYLRDEPFTLLELGIGGYKRAKDGGASLRMWKEFFPYAQIIGLDIEDKTFVNEERITAHVGSQVDEKLLYDIVASADNLRVIIDDGSHENAHILESFRILFPLLPDDAHYVIEDTQTSYWPRYGGSADPKATDTSIGLAKSFLDDINYEEHTNEGDQLTYTQEHIVGVHGYHNLVFVDKALNNEGRGPLGHH